MRERNTDVETTPLIRQVEQEDHAHDGLDDASIAAAAHGTWPKVIQQHWTKWSGVYLCGLFIFCVDLSTFLAEGPRLDMLQLGLCRDHYARIDPTVIRPDDGSVPEHLCRIREIQSSLARTRGFLGLLENLPGLVLAIPYGILADSRGRRLVVSISLVGLILRECWYLISLYLYRTFPFAAVYVAPAFVVVGGGPSVISPTVLAIVAASTKEDTRTQAFLLVQVVILGSELISSPISSLLMKHCGSYVAFSIATVVLFLGFPLITLMPKENRKAQLPGYGTRARAQEESSSDVRSVRSRISQSTRSAWSFSREGFNTMFKSKILCIGIASLAIQKLARPILELLLQYMSVRFDWALSDAVYLISLQAAVQIVLFLFVVPPIYSWILRRYHGHTARANLRLARLLVTFLCLGSFAMGLAPVAGLFIIALLIYTCGTGFAQAMRALLTSLLPEDRITLLYTSMALVEGLTSLAASPLIGLTFSAGINAGGMGTALPFFVAGCLYGLAGVGVWVIDIRRESDRQ